MGNVSSVDEIGIEDEDLSVNVLTARKKKTNEETAPMLSQSNVGGTRQRPLNGDRASLPRSDSNKQQAATREPSSQKNKSSPVRKRPRLASSAVDCLLFDDAEPAASAGSAKTDTVSAQARSRRDPSSDDDSDSAGDANPTRRRRRPRSAPVKKLDFPFKDEWLDEKPARRRAAERSRERRSSEVMAAAHIFLDEVRAHLVENADSIEEADVKALKKWTLRVMEDLAEQDQLVLENVDLVGEERAAQAQINKVQDNVVYARSQIRALQHEAAELQAAIAAGRREQASRQAASNFLDALDRLR